MRPDEARLLLNIALMAVGSNRFRSAARLLAVLEAFRPDSVALANAKAIALMSARRFAEAVDYIDSVMRTKFPDSAMLGAFRGMALLRLERNAEAEVSLRAVASQRRDPVAAKMAADLLKG